MYDHRRTVKIVLPSGDLLSLLGVDVRFEPFYPKPLHAQLPSGAADLIALVCLDAEGHEVGRIRMDAILGYLME
jgi:hypothetical protein